MGFWDSLTKTLETMGTIASAHQISTLAENWITADFQDLNHLEATVNHHVASASTEELRMMDQALRTFARSNAFNDRSFEKTMWLFACLHGAWSVRINRHH